MRRRITGSLAAVADVTSNRGLRRLVLAWCGSATGSWAYSVALAVYAYRGGGASAVGLVLILRTVPAAIAGPFLATLGDRYPRSRVMIGSDLARAAALTAAAVAIATDAPAGVVYALAATVSVVATAFRPAQAALLPAIARTPEELTAANVASSTIDSLAVLVGPALGGLLLAVTGTTTVFVVTAVTFLWSALLVSGVHEPPRTELAGARPAFLAATADGFRAVLRSPSLRLLVTLYGCQALVAGALTVFLVTIAFDLVHVGQGGLGLLTSALGVGALIGAVLALGLVGRMSLTHEFSLGILIWALPLAAIAVVPGQLSAFALLALIGLGDSLVEVAGTTLIQRIAPEDVLARVFGVLGTVFSATFALGGLIAPLLIGLLGARGALVVSGLFLPAAALLAWRPLGAIEPPAGSRPQIALLRDIPIFTPLSRGTIERLARSLERHDVEAGREIFHQGAVADRFYAIAEGAVDVDIDGASCQPVADRAGSSARSRCCETCRELRR